MIYTLKQKISSTINLGITDELNNHDKIQIRVLNSFILLIMLFQFSIWIQEFCQFDWVGVGIISAHLTFSLILLKLSSIRRFQLSSFLLNLLYPTVLFSLVFVYLPPNNLEYVFILFIFTSILIQKKTWAKVILVGTNLGFYLFTQSQHELIGKAGKEMDIINNLFIFMMTVGTTLIILQIVLHELQKYEANNQRLILELKQQNEKLSYINEELERFTYIVSHDMKTPLRSINSFITIIDRKLPNTDDDVKRYFKYIQDSTKQLHHLIIDSLEYAKIGQDEIQLEPLSINEILFDLIRNFSTENVEVYTETFPDIVSNKTLARKLFQNIIENGIKYNQSEEKIINITFDKNDNNVIFKITDNGIGIDKKYHKNIFGMYKQLNSKSKYSGAGLGLAISKKIVRQLNGEVWVESILGKGSTFFIQLPAKAV